MRFPIRQWAGACGALIAAFALSGPAARAEAPAPAPVLSPAAVETPAGNVALWKVADEDTTIYLFGTIHLLDGDDAWFSDTIGKALTTSDQLVTEVDQDSGAAASAMLLRRAMLPQGQNLRALMSAEDRAAYEKALRAIRMPAETFDRFKPWYAGLMLNLLPLMQNGYSVDKGVEAVLTARKRPQTGTGALETMEEQVDLFDALPQTAQLAYLRSTAKAAPDMVATIAGMVKEWRAGNADALAELINDEETDPALLDRILYARNTSWANWIVRRLEQPGTVFVAVGAGHLAGQGSVQDQLRRRGIGSARVQ